MNLILALIALLILGTAAVAVTRRNLIHSVLLFVASWAGVAAFYLWAGAEFVAFAQLLVYVGAVAMLALFAVLLTRRSEVEVTLAGSGPNRLAAGLAAGAAVFAVLAFAIVKTPLTVATEPSAPAMSVRALGTDLMSQHGAAVLAIGVLLTVALLGAVMLAATDAKEKGGAP